MAAAVLAPVALAATHAAAPGPAGCNATLVAGWSVGATILKSLSAPSTAACCAACVAEARCLAFVLHGQECFLKADAGSFHAMGPVQPLNHGGVTREHFLGQMQTNAE